MSNVYHIVDPITLQTVWSGTEDHGSVDESSEGAAATYRDGPKRSAILTCCLLGIIPFLVLSVTLV